MRSTQARTLAAGMLVAGAAAVLAAAGDALGLDEVWPVLLVAGAGLLLGVPRLRHALALITGVLAGGVTLWADAAVLPDIASGRALATVLGVAALTAVTFATRGWLRLSVQLVGWAAALAHAGPAVAAVPTGGAPLLMTLAVGLTTLLVAAGLGLLLAQVVQLATLTPSRRDGGRDGGRDEGRGEGRDGGGSAAAIAGGVLVAGSVLALSGATSPAFALGDDGQGTVEHRQTIVRTYAADGTPSAGSVVTKVGTSGTGGVSVVLRDQAVRDLRSLTGLAASGPFREDGAPMAVGRTVTHRLPEGASVRTVATLDRSLPVDLAIGFTLDGQPVTPATLVGRSGRLEVTYTLTNLTVEPRDLRHFDGTGRPRTVTRDVAVPFVGELAVPLDDRFRGVRARGAAVSDGGIHAELVLAEPAGGPVRTITWSADVVDAVVPPVQIRLTPVALTDTLRGGADLARLRRSTAALRDLSDAAGLAITGAIALEQLAAATAPARDDDLAARTVAILEGLRTSAGIAGAELGEVRALIEAQDERARTGDGHVHGVLAVADVRAADGRVPPAFRPSVGTSVVYVLDVAGREEGGGSDVPLRLALAGLLLGAVGLLGRATARLLGDRAG